MSARDDLDRFDSEWERHLEFRKGERGAKPHTYVGSRTGWDITLSLRELPSALRDSLIADLELRLTALIDAKREEVRTKLVERAKEEARRTLAELDALPDKMPGTYAAVVYGQPPYAPPIKLVVQGGETADPNHDHECG